MASEMVSRAAAAIADKWLEKVDDTTVRIGPPVMARAALLAALDPEDEALVEIAAKAIFTEAHVRGIAGGNVIALPWEPQIEEIKREYRDFGRAAIVALRAMSQGGTEP